MQVLPASSTMWSCVFSCVCIGNISVQYRCNERRKLVVRCPVCRKNGLTTLQLFDQSKLTNAVWDENMTIWERSKVKHSIFNYIALKRTWNQIIQCEVECHNSSSSQHKQNSWDELLKNREISNVVYFLSSFQSYPSRWLLDPYWFSGHIDICYNRRDHTIQNHT